MRFLFCNIGWMKNYNGIAGDTIERGGAFNKHDNGHEICNFSNIEGVAYGYVQPSGEQIKIEKLGADKGDEFINDVTIIWTAGPPSGGTVIVGWYKDATVYRYAQSLKKPNAIQEKNNIKVYRIKVPADKAVLLPIELRNFKIPRAVKGGIGQSNVWFADKKESKEIVENVIRLIDGSDLIQSFPDLDLEQSIMEGNLLLRLHLNRERNSSIIKAKKKATLEVNGKLCCEVCDFNFKDTYGMLGDEFCEVHHLQPLSKTDGLVETKLEDLAIICSNCHRMIHHSKPMLSIFELTKIIKNLCK